MNKKSYKTLITERFQGIIVCLLRHLNYISSDYNLDALMIMIIISLGLWPNPLKTYFKPTKSYY